MNERDFLPGLLIFIFSGLTDRILVCVLNLTLSLSLVKYEQKKNRLAECTQAQIYTTNNKRKKNTFVYESWKSRVNKT